MTNTIDAFLNSIDVSIGDKQHSLVTSPSSTAENVISPLTHYGILAIDGPDTATFLQGQTTCNLKEVDDSNSRYGGCCTVKGRLYSSFQIARLNSEQYRLRMRRDIVDDTQQRLAKYIVFSKAEQRNLSDELLVVGLQGPLAQARITACFGSAPERAQQSTTGDGSIAICLAPGMYECWITADTLAAVWPMLSEGMSLLGSEHWESQTIAAGLGEVTPETQELFIPQMLNYQATGAVSFTKGCYTGQEVVARLHYRGTPKRRTFVALLPAPELPEPGTLIFTDESEQSVGMVVNAAAGETGAAALVAVTMASATKTLHLQAPDGPSFTVTSPPYSLEQES